MNTNEQKLIDIVVSRTIPASPAEVYDAWLDDKSPGGPWFGPGRVILHAVVDGLFYHSVHHEGHDFAHYGRFVRLERGKLIEHTWVSEATKGVESVVTIALEPLGDDTLFKLRHSKVPDDQMGRQHEEGWTYIAGAIEERFRKTPGE
jgi:uncharacterized protein YndB with AHSA1/START domain